MEEKSIEYTAEYWEKRYKEKMKDLNIKDPTPFLREIVESDIFSEPGRVAIIGCATCQDVILFAKNNFLVTVISPSQSVVNQTRKKAQKLKSVIETIYADLFNLPGRLLHKYDYLIEYFFTSELPPDKQLEYLENIERLIKPGGFLIMLIQQKDTTQTNPPFHVDIAVLEDHLKEHFQPIQSTTHRLSFSNNNDEILMIWRKYIV